MRKRKQRQLVWRHANETLEETCIRMSRDDWKHKNQYLDPRMRRLKAVRDRRIGTLTAVLCDCTDDEYDPYGGQKHRYYEEN